MLGPYVNAADGTYTFENGNIKIDICQLTQCYQRLKTERRRWLYSVNASEPDSYGSDIYRLNNLGEDATPLLGEKIIFAALVPMVNDGEIKNLAVQYVGTNSYGAWVYKVKAETAKGKPLLFFYPPDEVKDAG